MANKDKKNETSFKEGNKAAEKWKFFPTARKMLELRNYVYQNSFNTVQKAVFSFGMNYSQYDYFFEKFPVLLRIKKDIHNFIIGELNDKALEPDSKISPALVIWRNKQLGEVDKIETTNKHEVTNKIDPSALSTEELIKRAKAIKEIELNE